MKQLVNKNLVTLKCVLFCFFAGVGSLFPFLPLHMLSVGLERGEARVISAVAPCVALIGPAILGPLLDKMSVGRGSTGGDHSGPSGSGRLLRVITALCMILSAIIYLLLLAVPYTERHEARRPQVLFMCDEDGVRVMQEVCSEGMRCNRWDGEKSGVLAVTLCEYGCADDNMTWLTRPFIAPPTTTTLRPLYANMLNDSTDPESLIARDEDYDDDEFEVLPPHICLSGAGGEGAKGTETGEVQCQVYLQRRLAVPLALLAPPHADTNDTDDNWCTYTTAKQSKCSVPAPRLEELLALDPGCRPAVRCQVLDPYDEPGGVLADAQCRRVRGDPEVTFWTYLVIRMLSDIFPCGALALLGAACVVATRETSLGRGDVGRQLAAGALGLAVAAPLAGMATTAVPDTPYLVCFIMHAAFMLLGAAILLLDSKMPLSTPEWWWHTATGALAMPMNTIRRYGAETAAVFAVVTLLGTFWSSINSYLPWTVVDLNGTSLTVGLAITAGAAPAAVALCWAEALIDFIGHSNVFIAAFIFYCLTFTGLGFSTSTDWLLACSALQVFTASLSYCAAVLYFRHLVPRRYTAAGQALPVIAHLCLGGCIGAIIGGIVSRVDPLEAAREVYRGMAVAALLVAAVYLALYHLLLAPRCQAPNVAPPHALLQGLNANGGTNGTYSPMRVYHEERSRKGHFRY